MQKIAAAVLCLYLATLPLLHHSAEAIFVNEFSASITLQVAAALLFLVFWRKEVRLTLTDVDLATACFLLWGVVVIVAVNRCSVDPFLPLKWISVTACYLVVKRSPHKLWLLWTLSLSGAAQALTAALQWVGLVAGNHSLFSATGCFANPGPLGGHIAVCLSATLGLLCRAVQRRAAATVTLLLVGCAIQGLGLFLSGSRAALVSLIAGAAVVFGSQLIALVKRHGIIFTATVAAFVVMACGLLYAYRPASVNGRLLVWRASAAMLAEQPVAGHGANAFAQKYMLYQADYFARHPSSLFAAVADNVAHPFNELVGVAVSTGVVGTLLLLALLFCALTAAAQSVEERAFKAGLLALCTFSLFSYPSEVFPLFLLYGVCLGAVGGRSVFRLSRARRWPVVWLLIPALYGAAAGIYVKKLSVNLAELHRKPLASGSVEAVDNAYHLLRRNTTFNSYYMAWLNTQPELLMHSNKIDDMLPSCEGYCLLGKHRMAKGNMESAEQALLTAAQMIPTRLRPKLYLCELYFAQGDTAAALRMAHRMIAEPVKVESLYTLRIKNQARRYLQQRR